MKTKFIPYLNNKKFRDKIIETLNKEGNIGLGRNNMNLIISHFEEKTFKDSFLNLCENFNVKYECFQIEEFDKIFFEIVVYKSGLEYSKMRYYDKKIDITTDLANELYKVVTIQITNDKFIENAKKMI